VTETNILTTAQEAKEQPDGQWVLADDGTAWCLVDTHMGWPQRMAMARGGRSLTALDSGELVYPLHLADWDGEPCPHTWGLVAEGHCRRCGALIDWQPKTFVLPVRTGPGCNPCERDDHDACLASETQPCACDDFGHPNHDSEGDLL
jgi:hypothetical protein